MINRNQRKRQFIQWLLANYQHVNPSVTYLLHYLMTQPHYIDSIAFSERVKYAPRGIYISYQNNTETPFMYFKDKLSYTLSEQAFHDLRLNQQFTKEIFYVEINIPEFYQQLYALDLFVENPYAPTDDEWEAQAEWTLRRISLVAEIKQLNQQLNQALEANDFELASLYLKQMEQRKGELDDY
ncbi:MAG: YpiB family protein [Aerococcaceae bacterium]|nr:YpiB family protein [Aerococcaceae bacterium]